MPKFFIKRRQNCQKQRFQPNLQAKTEMFRQHFPLQKKRQVLHVHDPSIPRKRRL
jgi:hypothetical protein